MNNRIILKAKNIFKSYQTVKNVRLEILKSVYVDIEEQKISVIIGASGAGKSTLLHIMGGLDRPDSGEIIFNDTSIHNLSDEKLAKFRNNNIGFVFQFHHLLPEFTAAENVMIPQMINGIPENKAFERGKKLLNEIGLSGRINHKPAELSGGEQQRVAVARALANDPQVILADEPTGNLDSQNSIILHELFLDLKSRLNKTFVIVTHNKDLISLADNLYEMKDGIILNKQ
jgi:lipoprotein-releasing system ATP-binding protein